MVSVTGTAWERVADSIWKAKVKRAIDLLEWFKHEAYKEHTI